MLKKAGALPGGNFVIVSSSMNAIADKAIQRL